MKSYLRNSWKMLSVFLAALLLAAVGYAQTSQGMKGDVTGEVKMKAGAETMLSAQHMLAASLEKQDLMKNPVIAKGNAMLMNGEKMILEGKQLMQNTSTRIEGKEMMMKGGDKMMEGKDCIMKELKQKGLIQSTSANMASLKEEERYLVTGENMMLKGKNMMMDGLRNYE